LFFEGEPKVDADTDTNAAIGYIKSGVDVGAEAEIQEINYMAIDKTVAEVANGAATKKTEGDLDRF
jgi:hypothetical protein